MENKTEKQKGIIALMLLALVFASMGLFARYLNSGFSVFQQVYLRVLAAFLLGLIIFNKDLNWPKIKKISQKEWLLLIFRSAASYLFAVCLFTQAVILAKYSNVAFIGAIPMTAILGIIIFKEKINGKKALLVLTAFLGVALIALKDYSQIFSWGKGEIIALAATFFFSLSYVTRKWHSPLLNNKEITQITFFFAFIFVLAVSLLSGEGIPVSGWNLGLLAAVIGAGLFNVINLFLTNYGFEKVKAVLAGNILMLESVFAVIVGFLFYLEVPNLKELLGGIIIIGSVVLMNSLEDKS